MRVLWRCTQEWALCLTVSHPSCCRDYWPQKPLLLPPASVFVLTLAPPPSPPLCLLLGAAGVLYSLFGRNLDTGEAVPYNDQHWRNVVARLHLTKRQVGGWAVAAAAGGWIAGRGLGGVWPDPRQGCCALCIQRHDPSALAAAKPLTPPVARLHPCLRLRACAQVTYILACAELYFSSLSSLMHERQALHEAMVAADGALSECQRRLLGVDGTLDQLSLLDKLSSNLKKEHVLRIMLNCFVWGRILSAVQFAKTAGG